MTDESTNEVAQLPERLGIVGSGTIATGLAKAAAHRGDVTLYARTDASAERARGRLRDSAAEVVTDLTALSESTYVVEAVVEEHHAKIETYRQLAAVLSDDAVLATSTSSLSIETLAEESGRPERFAGLHVFNPVDRMKLIELVFPTAATEDTRRRTHALSDALEKVGVEVPDTPGFVVNRLLFPYLFDAVRLMEQTGLEPKAIDNCMRFGAGHPLGPLALLDLVGIDVSIAIGESIGAEVPQRLYEMEEDGKLGRKTKAGFLDYS